MVPAFFFFCLNLFRYSDNFLYFMKLLAVPQAYGLNCEKARGKEDSC